MNKKVPETLEELKEQNDTGDNDPVNENKDYYESELKKVGKPDGGEYPSKIKISDGEGTSTKNLDLNQESAEALVAWLKQSFDV